MNFLTSQLKTIKDRIRKDNYANYNYEIACSYIKMTELLMKDKQKGVRGNYQVEMCPPKNPNIDSYIICTNQLHHDYAVQIKSKGNDNQAKLRLFHSQSKYSMNPNNYLLLVWDKGQLYDSYDSMNEVKTESVQDLLEYIEQNKHLYTDDYQFLQNCMQTILNDTNNHDETNWIILNRLKQKES